MRYIITAHLGLIGRELKRRLTKMGHICVGCYDSKDTSSITYPIEADIWFELAAHCKIKKCITNPSLAFANSNMVETALEGCRKNNIPKIVYFSSSRVLSKEMNPYTESKRYGENLCKAYEKCYGIKYLIIRPSTVYGGKDETNRLVNKWVNNALLNEDLIINGDNNKTLDFTYIDDFLDALFLVLNEDNKEYNISGGEELNLEQVAQEIINQTNSKSKIVFTSQDKQQPQQVKIDIIPLKEKGYISKIDIKHGIKKEVKRCELELLERGL